MAEGLRRSQRDYTQAYKGYEAVDIHNQERPRLSLKCKTPDDMHRAL